tara:strand:- start:750 stop:1604 length:855 start_codon:yes stop_codon:yes gene_type:complete
MAKEHFLFDFEADMVKELLQGNSEWLEWYEAMCEILPLWKIHTVERVAGFIAQCGHESRNFTVLTENLNYSAAALNKIFPKYFIKAGKSAQDYHRKPQAIANVIYADRMDNGSEDSGDGWKFRGGGILQLTGKYNYSEFAKEVDMDINEAVDYVRTKSGALDSACWFWDTNNINSYCDNQDIVGMSKRINGGTIGLADRKKHYIHALDVLGGDYEPAEPDYNTVIKRGSRGTLVTEIQTALGIDPADGIFGPGTEKIVKRWQDMHQLTVDGIVGPVTISKLLNK